MRKVRVWPLLLPVVVLMIVWAVELFAEQTEDQPKISIRQLEPQTVLYTIFRGGYDKMGPAIGKLYALAATKGIFPRGSLSCVYLNNPEYVSSEHLLIEIRIPVGKEAMELVGTLGEMTDVKTLPAMEVAVAVKPVGQADPGTIYNRLYSWIAKQGYRAADNACETFLTNNERNYAKMKSEIMIPVKKLSISKD